MPWGRVRLAEQTQGWRAGNPAGLGCDAYDTKRTYEADGLFSWQMLAAGVGFLPLGDLAKLPRQIDNITDASKAAKSGENLGVATRKINWRPDDPHWGLTKKHTNKHFFGTRKYSLGTIDPRGNADIWRGYIQDLASRKATGNTTNGMVDIVGSFPRTGGGGNFNLGIRLSPRSDGAYDLVTILTKQ